MSYSSIKINSRNRLLTPERAAFYIPVFSGILLAFFLLVGLLLPTALSMNETYFELREYQRKKSDLNKLKSQFQIINSKYTKLKTQNNNLITLLAGNNNLETLLAEINYLCSINLIDIVKLKPSSIERFKPSEELSDADNVNGDPLLSKGLEKYTAEIILSAPYTNLLEFIRDLELIENIIITKNFIFESDQNDINSTSNSLQLKFLIYAYGRQNIMPSK
ncbi:hypothetical protein [Prochlorococcus marinus]|uniref:hypothetical protein n=1 Tax=Prochlorococcus marinus TaxID=1219 RepID=UPI0022B47997|nr:hypothetical protein [Prochlorococcus marinus]